ncbi:MAG: glutaredoxin, partial [Halanaerobium sp.]
MAKIDQEEKNKIKELFSKNLKDNVDLLFFSKEEGCQYCGDTEEILSEVTGLDERVNFEKYLVGSKKAEEFGVDRAPAIIFLNNEGEDSGVHFYGIPSGYEFTSLIEDILDMSDHER